MSTGPRRSERTASKGASKSENFTPSKKHESSRSTAARKRQKTSHENRPVDVMEAQKQRRRGILQRILEVPVDILCEVFSNVHPKDLLSLCRTSKDVRSFLLNKYFSSTIWEHARVNSVPAPPDLPDDLSEPAYAHLLYDTHCHNCGQPSSKIMVWQVNLRLCKWCVVNSGILAPKEQITDASDKILFITPHYSSGFRIYYHVESYGELEEMFEAIEDATEKQAWYIEQTQGAKQDAKLADKLWDFGRRVELHRSRELEAIRTRRTQDVVSRLNKGGWEAELKNKEVLKVIIRHELVRQPQDLTEEGWIKIEPILANMLVPVRQERLRFEKEQALERRLKTFKTKYHIASRELPGWPIVPPVTYIRAVSTFRQLLIDSSLSLVALETKLKDIFPQLVEITENWRALQTSTLKNLLQHAGRDDDLSLAASGFKCTACNVVMHYPDVLVHRCLQYIETGDDNDLVEPPPIHTRLRVVSPAQLTQLEMVMKLRGLDIKTGTTAEMDDWHPFVTCRVCSRLGEWRTSTQQQAPSPSKQWRRSNVNNWTGPKLFVMRWRDAVARRHAIHDEDTESCWAIVEDANMIDQLRQAEEHERTKRHDKQVRCYLVDDKTGVDGGYCVSVEYT